MTDLIARLAEIRQMQGRDPLPDPTRIQGYAEPPTDPPPFEVNEEPWPPLEEPEDQPGPPIGTGPEPEPSEPPLSQDAAMDLAELLTKKELVVMDRSAMFRQRSVQLSETEWSAVVQVVLKSIRRSLDEQYAEVAGVKPRLSKPRRQRGPDAGKGQAVSVADAPGHARESASASTPAPRRRGRPPKQRLDGGER